MTALQSTDRAGLPLGKRGAFEEVARWQGCQRNPARTTPRSSLRTPTNRPDHTAQRWVEKVGRSIKGSDTPQVLATGDAQRLARARYALWKNPENLTEHQREKLAWIAATD